MTIPEFISPTVLKTVVVLLVGLPLVVALASGLGNLVRRKTNDHLGMLVRKTVLYGGGGFLLIAVLQQAGMDLTVLLASAGVATVAIGFAAQTSLSNIISGLFLLVEKPFQIGDVIRVSGTTGIVHSVDLMSVKLRTFDNLFIRIPNETMIKSELTNITRFPIRRMDFDVKVVHGTDLSLVMKVLEQAADANSFALDEPRPLILLKGFSETGMDVMLGVWFEKSKFLDLRNSMVPDLQKHLAEAGIQLARPLWAAQAGKEGLSLPVRLSGGDGEPID